MLEDGGYFEDGVFGYDFSEGYTSLESGTAKVRPYRESALKRWRRRRSELRRQRRMAREAAEEKRMDEILEKLHREGRSALTDEEHRFLVRVSTRIATGPRPVIEPTRIRRIRAEAARPARGGRLARPGWPIPRRAWSARPLVLDAAMGTRLVARGWICGDDDPASGTSRIRRTSAISIAATSPRAADAVLTNTFGANRSWLARFGRPARSKRSIAARSQLAREAAGPRPVRARRRSGRPRPAKPAPRPSRPASWSTPASTPCASRPSSRRGRGRCSARSPRRSARLSRSWSASGTGPSRPDRPRGA